MFNAWLSADACSSVTTGGSCSGIVSLRQIPRSVRTGLGAALAPYSSRILAVSGASPFSSWIGWSRMMPARATTVSNGMAGSAPASRNASLYLAETPCRAVLSCSSAASDSTPPIRICETSGNADASAVCAAAVSCLACASPCINWSRTARSSTCASGRSALACCCSCCSTRCN